METIKYLDMLKQRYNWPSDYRLAKELNISQSRMSNYRCGKTSMDDDLALQVEKLLELPPGTIILQLHAERTKCPQAARVLKQISKQIGSAAASFFVAVSVIYLQFSPSLAGAADAVASLQHCILC